MSRVKAGLERFTRPSLPRCRIFLGSPTGRRTGGNSDRSVINTLRPKLRIRELTVPKRWRAPFAILSIAAVLGTAVADLWFLQNYFGHHGRNVPIAFYRPALCLLLLGVPFSWYGLRGPRLSVVAFPILFVSLFAAISHGLELTDLSYLDRPGPHFPLEDYPWSFERLGSFGALELLLLFALLGWVTPRVIKRLQNARKRSGWDGRGEASASDGDKPSI